MAFSSFNADSLCGMVWCPTAPTPSARWIPPATDAACILQPLQRKETRRKNDAESSCQRCFSSLNVIRFCKSQSDYSKTLVPPVWIHGNKKNLLSFFMTFHIFSTETEQLRKIDFVSLLCLTLKYKNLSLSYVLTTFLVNANVWETTAIKYCTTCITWWWSLTLYSFTKEHFALWPLAWNICFICRNSLISSSKSSVHLKNIPPWHLRHADTCTSLYLAGYCCLSKLYTFI